MTIEQLRAQLEAVINKMEALNSLTVGENGEIRSFSQEESDKYGKFETQAKELRESIKRLENLREQRQEVERLNQPQTTAPRIDVVREDKHNEQNEYRGYGEIKRGGLGEFLIDVQREVSRGVVSNKLKELRASLGANEAIGSEGGSLVQTDHAEMLYDNTKTAGIIASQCFELPVSGNSTKINLLDETSLALGSMFGGVSAGWRGESGSSTASKPKFNPTLIAVEALEALFYATNEQLEDAPQLGALANKFYPIAMAAKLDDAIIAGTGNGKPLGIINAPGTIVVAKESEQAADTINYLNIKNIKKRMLVGSRNKARFFLHADVEAEIEDLIKTGTNTDWFVGQAVAQTMKYPYQVSDQCRAIGDKGDIILGDFSQYLLVKKNGIQAAQSMHVAWLTSEMAFKWTMRVNGMPMNKSAITDANGSTTRSPFVVLAERA